MTNERADALDLALLDAIFGADRVAGELKEYGKYDSALAVKLEALSSAALASVVTEGFRRKPPGRGFGGLMLVAQWALLVAGFVIVTISRSIFLEGMKLYLPVAEEERLRVLQSPDGAERINVGNNLELVKLCEKLLPWAVVWGVEDQWMHELELRVASLDEAPDWFVRRSGFEAALFTSAVRGVSATTTAPASSSSWSGSGGGGFSGGSSGGGFSGGGGGGGCGGGRLACRERHHRTDSRAASAAPSATTARTPIGRARCTRIGRKNPTAAKASRLPTSCVIRMTGP